MTRLLKAFAQDESGATAIEYGLIVALIAGFVLTIGTAVDANVLINERIREEQRIRNRAAVSAVEFGYKEASRAIFDANITNVISAAIMRIGRSAIWSSG